MKQVLTESLQSRTGWWAATEGQARLQLVLNAPPHTLLLLCPTSSHWGTVVQQTRSRRSTVVAVTQKYWFPRNISIEFLHLGHLRWLAKFGFTDFPERTRFSIQTSPLLRILRDSTDTLLLRNSCWLITNLKRDWTLIMDHHQVSPQSNLLMCMELSGDPLAMKWTCTAAPHQQTEGGCMS